MMNEQQTARAFVVAVDRPLIDQTLDESERVEHRIDELAPERPVPIREPSRPVFELRDHHPAVPRARTCAQGIGLDEHHLTTASGQLGGRHDPAVPAPDHGDVGRTGEHPRLVDAIGQLHLRVPQRRGAEPG